MSVADKAFKKVMISNCKKVGLPKRPVVVREIAFCKDMELAKSPIVVR
jgi:hypothetical protein